MTTTTMTTTLTTHSATGVLSTVYTSTRHTTTHTTPSSPWQVTAAVAARLFGVAFFSSSCWEHRCLVLELWQQNHALRRTSRENVSILTLGLLRRKIRTVHPERILFVVRGSTLIPTRTANSIVPNWTLPLDPCVGTQGESFKFLAQSTKW